MIDLIEHLKEIIACCDMTPADRAAIEEAIVALTPVTDEEVRAAIDNLAAIDSSVLNHQLYLDCIEDAADLIERLARDKYEAEKALAACEQRIEELERFQKLHPTKEKLRQRIEELQDYVDHILKENTAAQDRAELAERQRDELKAREAEHNKTWEWTMYSIDEAWRLRETK